MNYCKAQTMSGGRCERLEGHDGKHQRSLPTGGEYEWTDEQVTAAIETFDRRRR